MKTILVPTDFSKNAENALKYAIHIAKRTKAKIILLHAYNVTYTSPDVPIGFYSEQLEATKAETSSILEEIARRVILKSKVPYQCVSSEGPAVDVIHATARKKKVGLIVMGTKGASGLKEVLIGSVAARVLINAKYPLIVVPGKAAFTGISQITFATDFHQGDVASLKKLAEFAQTFRSKISVVHVADPEYSDEAGFMEKFQMKARKRISYRSLSFQLLKAGEPEKKLESHIKRSSSDLLAITNSDMTWMERVLFKHVSKKLVYHTRIPMIVFHNSY